MSSLNRVMLIGNLGQDPELKHLNSGDAVVNLSVATTERWKDKQTGEQKEKTEWSRVVAFGRLAEIMAKYLKKGSKVYIEGSLQTRKWTDSEGVEKYTTEIKAREMKMLDSKGSQDAQPSQPKPAPAGDSFDDDIPF